MPTVTTTRGKRPSLEEGNPEVARYWHPERNPGLTPLDVTVRARRSVWWRCQIGHEFESPVFEHANGLWCTDCREEWAEEAQRIGDSLVTDHAALVAAWDSPASMEGVRVNDVDLLPFNRIYLKCPKGHRVNASAFRYLTAGCPSCRGHGKDKVYLSTAYPELAEQWHPTRNKQRPGQVTEGSKRQIWWRTECCGYEWEESPGSRQKYDRYRCPRCKTILDSLGRRDPELAAEWHPGNDRTPFHVKPFTAYVARWICSQNPNHEWEAALASRSSGAGCPQCTMAGTSRIEQAFAAAFAEVHPGAKAARVAGWRVDVYVHDLSLIVEYDGSYWHAEKQAVDTRKTLELIEAGYRVARIRELDLPFLPVDDHRVHQIRFRPATQDVSTAAKSILHWVKTKQAGSPLRHEPSPQAARSTTPPC